MAIKKQEFYEGAALHLIARSGCVDSIRYDAPFFLFNDRLSVLLKYSTKGRSPWAFTFTTDEQIFLEARASKLKTAKRGRPELCISVSCEHAEDRP